MTLLRPLSGFDALFLATAGLLLAASVGYRTRGDTRLVRGLGVLGWGFGTVFWAGRAVTYLITSRIFLGLVGFVTVVVAAYAATLVARGRRAGVDLTVAFSVMGLLFVPFEFFDPVHRAVLGTVAAHVAWILSLAGYAPVVGQGPQGYANVIYFAGRPVSHSIRIISACSGISAIALFVGLITASRDSRRRRFVAAVAVTVLIYGLNIVRAVFVAGALGGRWFAFAARPVGAVFGVTDPAIASYYVAEYLIAQVLIVVVLLWVYGRVADRLPALQRLVDGVLETGRADLRHLAQR